MVNEKHMAERLTRANPVVHPEHLHEDPAEADALLALILERRDDMTLTREPLPTKPPRRPRWQPARIAAVAAVLVVLVIGVVALIGFGGADSDTAEQATTVPVTESTVSESEPTVAPSTAAPETTATAETAVPSQQPGTLFDGTWTHETSTEPFSRFEVIETSLGYFSVGDGEGVWFSPDGSDWSQVLALPAGEIIEDAELLPGEPPLYTIEARVGSLVEYRGAVYAIALVAEDAHTPQMVLRRMAYRTSDGERWEETEIPGARVDGGDITVAGDDELLVILSPSDQAAFTMRTVDGVTWTRHEQNGFEVADVVFVDGRYLGVAGFPESPDYPWGRLAMAESSDGIEWTEIPGSTFAYNDQPHLLMSFDGMLYMGGLYYDEQAEVGQTGMVFYSTDGARWQRATMPEADLRFVTDLIPTEYGLLAVGWTGWSDDPARVVPMTTSDGTTFVELPHAEGMFASQGEAFQGYREGQDIVLFGIDFEPGRFHRWTWTPGS